MLLARSDQRRLAVLPAAKIMKNLKERMVKPRIGLLPIGHFYYWDQFPRLKDMGMKMYAELRENLENIGAWGMMGRPISIWLKGQRGYSTWRYIMANPGTAWVLTSI